MNDETRDDLNEAGEPDLSAGLPGETAPEEVIPKKEYGELHDKYLRLHAEFENFRRRTDKARKEFQVLANEKLILDLLPVLDNLELALRHAHDGEPSAGLAEGIELVAKQFRSVLEKYGISAIEAEGKPFDPRYHEALSQEETDDLEDNTVMKELQRGYRLADRTIRPARVIVSRRAIRPRTLEGDEQGHRD